LNRPEASIVEVEDLVKRDPSLTYRVLQCVNSAAFGVRRELQSIRQALVLLGLDQVRKWASVWALAG
jgi:EAL and modified HD-GYP domain-containing signal transduction protein